MRFLTAIALPLLVLDRAVATSTSTILHIHHRFLPFPHSSSSLPSWVPLGSAQVDSDMTATQLSGHTEHALGGTEGQERNDGKGWYQVGIEREGEWVMASTRVCLLSTSPPGLVLHMTDSHLSSMSLNTVGSRCTNSSNAPTSSLRLPSSSQRWDIQIQRPVKIFSPAVSSPAPAADPTTGLPVQPVPEKSFLQKYWLPLLGIALFAVGQLAPSGT